MSRLRSGKRLTQHNALSLEESGPGVNISVVQKEGQRRRRDGTINKMSFDVDELEEGLYAEVEDEEPEEDLVVGQDPDARGEALTLQKTTSRNGDGGEHEGKESNKTNSNATLAEDSAEEFKMRPDLNEKFRPGLVQVLIERVIKGKLEGKTYSREECEVWVQQILNEIHRKVKGENYKRYKLISQVTLGERQGEGVSSATRCLWDAEADCMATYTFLNDTIFCNGTVYGIYFY